MVSPSIAGSRRNLRPRHEDREKSLGVAGTSHLCVDGRNPLRDPGVPQVQLRRGKMDRGFGVVGFICRFYSDVPAIGAAFLVFDDLEHRARLNPREIAALFIRAREPLEISRLLGRGGGADYCGGDPRVGKLAVGLAVARGAP